MKGQYLAVESITTFGMGLLLAIGMITTFSSYKSDVLQQARESQANIIESDVVDAVHRLRSVDSGHTSVELPETIAGQDYTLAFNDGVKVYLYDSLYSSSLGELSQRYEFQGSVGGGSVKVYKNGDKFTVRAD